MVLPATSRMLMLWPEAAGFSRRSTSTKAPGGIGEVRKRFAVVTALLAVASQTGVLSPVSASVVLAETLATCQSEAANGAVRQTSSLYVTVTTLPATDIPVNVGRVRSMNVYVRPFDAAAPLFVRVSVTEPGAWAGVVVFTEVLPQLVTTALVPPKETAGNAGVHVMPVPVRVTESPPAVVPLQPSPLVVSTQFVSVAAPPLAPPPTVASW